MPSIKHNHKPYQVNNGRTWRCALETCTWMVHKGSEHLLVNQHMICWGCGDIFCFDEPALSQPKPKCVECRIAETMSQLTETKSTPVTETNPNEPESPEDAERRKIREQMWGYLKK